MRKLVLFFLTLAAIAWSAPSPARAQSSALGPQGTAAALSRTAIVGFTASLTGNVNVESTRQTNGIKMWVDDVNKAGGIRLADGSAVTVDIRFYDDESNKDRVQQLYTRLINEDRADFLISPYSSGLTDAAAVIAEQYGRVMVTAGASSDSTHDKGYSLAFMTYTPASRYLTGAFDVLAHLDPAAKRVAIVHERDKFSTDVATAAKSHGEAKGYEIVLFEGYASGTTDFAPFINRMPGDVDAIMGGGHFADTSTFARQLAEKGIHAKFIALLVAPPEPRFGELGAAALGVIGPSQWESTVKYSPEAARAAGLPWHGPSVGDFVARYRERFGDTPSYHGAGGYAAGLILEQAIARAGSLETAKVKAALDGTDMLTFFGHTKYDTSAKRHGRQVGHEMVYIQWQKDEQGRLVKRVVWPEDASTANPLYPARDQAAAGPSQLLTSLVDGLMLGFVYGLAAMGMTLIWGILRIINLSHGAVIALGMFASYFLFTHLGVNPYVGLVAVAGAGLLLGLLIYPVAVHRVIHAPHHLTTLLATFAVNMIFIGLGTALLTTTPRNIDYSLGTARLGPVALPGTRLMAALMAILVASALTLFLRRTRLGKAIRAVASNRASAELMGIPSSRVLALSFGLGTMLAAASGALIATFFPFTILSGESYQLKSFVIGVLGGLGNPIGALAGGLLLGMLEGLIPIFLPVSWVPVVEFALFVLVLLLRPSGLMGART
ncbi:ABC transporter substrate-binding protein [Sorangium sp. So ce296]|uniref:ABC transporter substrate-binding protein n=1 Tax=Sorangium sp. So ce296 TaxID=3133296 RepID=UPI003F5FF5FC